MFRKSSSEKTIQGLEKGMNMHFYSHLQKNPQLVEASEEKLMKSVWDDPYVTDSFETLFRLCRCDRLKTDIFKYHRPFI